MRQIVACAQLGLAVKERGEEAVAGSGENRQGGNQGRGYRNRHNPSPD